MTDYKHTPGPWVAVETGEIYTESGIAMIAISTGEDYGGYYGDDVDVNAQKKANAHLIAAAPDLLEALERMVDDVPFGDEPEYALAALAKARGEN